MVAFSEPENRVNKSLGIQLENSITTGGTLGPVYIPRNSNSDNPSVGVSGFINFNSSKAPPTVPILGSIRTVSFCSVGNCMSDLIVNLSLATLRSYWRWSVREHQNQRYAYGHGALILLILLASPYR